MKQTHRAKAMRIVAFILTVILSIALCISLAACNNGNQPNTPNPPQNNNNNNNNYPETQEPETPDGNEDNKDNDEDPNEQDQPGGQQQPGDQEQPDEQPEEQDISREEFEEELAVYLQNYYEEHEKVFYGISDLELLAFNKLENMAYFRLISNEVYGFATVKFADIDYSSYKKMLESIKSLDEIEFSKLYSRITEQGVPEDICAFALSQQQVQNFLYANGVDSSDLINYTIINTTEFNSANAGICSNITMLVGNKIFTLTIGGHLGGCRSQREYLTKLQNGLLSVIDEMQLTDYEELALEQA